MMELVAKKAGGGGGEIMAHVRRALVGQGLMRIEPDRLNGVLEKGVELRLNNFIDVTNDYAERKQLGDFLKNLHPDRRSQIVVSTKFGVHLNPTKTSTPLSHFGHYDISPGTFETKFDEIISDLGHIDNLMIQNPELNLKHHTPKHRAVLKDSLDTLFSTIESKIASNPDLIKSYGISSNDFPAFDYNELNYTPNFKFIQTATNSLQPLDPDLRKFAKEKSLKVVTHQPLTYFRKDEKTGNMTRMKMVEYPMPVSFLEADTNLRNWVKPGFDDKELLKACVWLKRFLEDLKTDVDKFDSVEHFRHDLEHGILPLLNSTLDGMDEETFELLRVWFLEYEKYVAYGVGEQVKDLFEENTFIFNMKLHEKALRDALDQEDVDFVVIGMNDILQMESVRKCRDTKSEEEIILDSMESGMDLMGDVVKKKEEIKNLMKTLLPGGSK